MYERNRGVDAVFTRMMGIVAGFGGQRPRPTMLRGLMRLKLRGTALVIAALGILTLLVAVDVPADTVSAQGTPPLPTGVKVMAQSATEFKITWNSNSSYWSELAVNQLPPHPQERFSQKQDKGIGEHTMTDGTPLFPFRYDNDVKRWHVHVRFTTEDPLGPSPCPCGSYTDAVQAAAKPGAPTALAATNVQDHSATLSWTKLTDFTVASY